MKRYEDTLKTAESRRLKHSACSVILGKYQIWTKLETVEAHVAITYAVSDKLHSHDNIFRIIQQLPQGKEVLCPTNLYMHSADLLTDIEAFAQEILAR